MISALRDQSSMDSPAPGLTSGSGSTSPWANINREPPLRRWSIEARSVAERPPVSGGTKMKYWRAAEKARVKGTSERRTLTSFLGMQERMATESSAPGWLEATNKELSAGVDSCP